MDSNITRTCKCVYTTGLHTWAPHKPRDFQQTIQPVGELENACHELDLLQTERDTGENQAGTSFGRYLAALRRLSELQRLYEVTKQVCIDGDQLLMHLALSILNAENNHSSKAAENG